MLERLLDLPTIASKRWVYEQYDTSVQTNTVIGPGGDAAVLRVRDTTLGLALTSGGNGRYVWLDPYEGGQGGRGGGRAQHRGDWGAARWASPTA